MITLYIPKERNTLTIYETFVSKQKKGDVMKNITMILIVMVSIGFSYEKDSTGVVFTPIEIAYANAFGWETDSTNADATIEKINAVNNYNDPRTKAIATAIAVATVRNRAVELPAFGGKKGWAQKMINEVAPTKRFFGLMGAQAALTTDTTLTAEQKFQIEAVLTPPANPYYKVDPNLTTEVVALYSEEGYNVMNAVMSDLKEMLDLMKQNQLNSTP